MQNRAESESNLRALEGAMTAGEWLMTVSPMIGTYMLKTGSRTPDIASRLPMDDMRLRELLMRKRLPTWSDRKKIMAFLWKISEEEY